MTAQRVCKVSSTTWVTLGANQEHQKFAQEFQQTMRVLHQFTRAADQQIPFLQRKAQRLREYLNQR